MSVSMLYEYFSVSRLKAKLWSCFTVRNFACVMSRFKNYITLFFPIYKLLTVTLGTIEIISTAMTLHKFTATFLHFTATVDKIK